MSTDSTILHVLKQTEWNLQTKLGEMVCKQHEILMPKACSRGEKLVASQTFYAF
jgi:hypothetical protein